jgi:hypothetical protein
MGIITLGIINSDEPHCSGSLSSGGVIKLQVLLWSKQKFSACVQGRLVKKRESGSWVVGVPVPLRIFCTEPIPCHQADELGVVFHSSEGMMALGREILTGISVHEHRDI